MAEPIQGTIYKALSGFYYVAAEGKQFTCRARGKFRKEKQTPLVGDRVMICPEADGTGTVDAILPRKNVFVRPPIANIDALVIIVANVIPVTDPYLVDRMTAIAANSGCESIICINKCDLDRADDLFEIYSRAGFTTLRVSAETKDGIPELSDAIAGRICAFTGNSGVGKSSILNAMLPELAIRTGEVSEKLGRGRHTTRHVELFAMPNGAMIADTPGFSAFDAEQAGVILKDRLPYAFPEFAPYLEECRFTNCSHTGEKGCAVLEALARGEIQRSRHDSYLRMYRQAKQINAWELPNP